MRTLPITLLLIAANARPALAAEEGGGSLLSPSGGVMFWTILIFGVLLLVLSRYAFKPMLAAVQAREQALQDAIDTARADRDEAARLLAEHRAQLDASRAEAQKLIADGRATAEKMKSDMLDATRTQQQEMAERAKRDIDAEKTKAIAELRREAVEIAIAGASKVVERNLDNDGNRALVETFLASIPAAGTRR